MSMTANQGEEQLDQETLAALYEGTFKNFEEGTITNGCVVAIRKDRVVVDIGYKSEGLVASDQFSTEELATLKVGDPVQVGVAVDAFAWWADSIPGARRLEEMR